MMVWEYCCHEIKSTDVAEIEAALLLLGDKGWEAVCMIPTGSYLLLKRPKDPMGNAEAVAAASGDDIS